MSKEQAVQIKPEKKPSKKSLKNRQELDKEGGRICIIHSQNNKSEKDVRPLTEHSFIKIKEVASVKQQSSSENTRLSDIIEKLPEELDSSVHGYHRKCYQTFTNIARLKRKIGNTDIATDEANASKRRRSSGLSIAGAILFPADKCLFCDKKVLKIKGDKQPLVKCVTKTAETSIRLAAEQKNDENLLCQIRDIDLIAKEAHYHNHCRRSYTRSDVRRPINPNSETSAVLSAHKKAFDSLCKYVQENIIEQMKVERMTMLRERYLLYLLEVDSTVHNENYKTDKLKDKLKNFFGGKIQFWRPSSKGELVYSNDVEKGQAVELAFELACSDEKRVEEAAMILRRHITESKKVAAEMPYPPTASWLMSEERQPPTLLRDFLSNLVAGKSKEKLSAKALRFVSSCSQDICFATINGQWAMPKHILLAMTIHHLTGSAEIISLLNRYGHCQSYTRTLELETAMCNIVTAFNNILPPSISIENNSVVHLCWDNFDLNEETLPGAGTTHTAHGIIIQELENDSILRTRDLPQVPKTNERTVHPVIEDIQPCFAKAKAEPKLNVSRVQPEPCDSMYFNFSDFMWMLCRKESSETEQNIPSWAGWLSATSQPTDQSGKEPRCSIVDYMAPVLQPVTENATVQHILEVSKKATENVGQDFTIVTFDLGVAKKAFNIVWQNHIRFGNVIIRIGVFHTICSLFGALGKHMKGSGFEDIAIEAGICASGSLQKVMSGKHYSRALRVHKLVLEALERLLFEAFQTHDQLVEGLSDETENVVRKLVEKPDCEHFQSLVRTQDFKRLFDRYEVFKDSVRNGSLGKTSQFWLGYMDIIWSILSFIRATKENNLELHLAILYELCPLFFTYNHHNYSRYIPAYLMLNLSETHPGAEELLRKNGFSVSRSTVPLSRNPVDITIEQTINCHAKSHGGIIGFSRNYSAYYRWCVT